ncbi:TPA: hypothetical protein ACF35N_000819 [Vibrio parahaemolyticus]|uniref:hypothetical protein n=1 Tax=Vibrio parahaemolyticus TaxID=670 RepID=UPI0011211DFA|nr:hypothetical protein [Vibrio parahaemolyticus]TNZ90477.1 hypothetical protein CGK38_13450 [Vibrio parahaemolyticus]
MAKVIIIDDDITRHALIKKNLITIFGLTDEQIDSAYSSRCAKQLLTKLTYNIVFLDMALPKFPDSSSIDPWAGVDILKGISRGKYSLPEKIIGYTALDDDLEDKEKQFSDIGFSLDFASSHDISWLNKRKDSIKYSILRSYRQGKVEKDFAILTVHGIRTFGSWQNRLFKLVKEHHKTKKVEHLEFKFTGIDLFTFIFPRLRRKVIHKLVSELRMWLLDNKVREIYCFSHSFGTYLTIKALEELTDEPGVESIKYVVLSGSVLDKDYDFSQLKKNRDITVINDCAVSDVPLLFSEAFVLDTGMAGITGFRGISANKIQNRFFKGGHSHFFDEQSKFMTKFWLPLFDDIIEDTSVDIKVGFFQEFAMLVARLLSTVKDYMHWLAIFVILVAFFSNTYI